jgi:hypothetical protein
MPPLVRSALVLLAGVVVALIVVTLGDTVAGGIYSLPPGVSGDPESLRQAVAALPSTAFLLLLAGWVLAAAAGSYVAARTAAHDRVIHGMIVTLFMLVATVGNLAGIPHPGWLWPAVIILIPAGGWLATRLVVGPRSTPVAG